MSHFLQPHEPPDLGRGEKVEVILSGVVVGILEMCLRGLFSKSQTLNGDSEQLT